MAMSEKDYKLIAAALRDAAVDQNICGRYEAREGVQDAAIVLSRRLQNINPRFDRARFLIACGLDPDCRAVQGAS